MVSFLWLYFNTAAGFPQFILQQSVKLFTYIWASWLIFRKMAEIPHSFGYNRTLGDVLIIDENRILFL